LNFLGRHGRAAVLGILSCAALSGAANAQQAQRFDVGAAIASLDTDVSAKPLGTVQTEKAVAGAAVAMSNAIQTVSGTLMPAPASFATEAAWLFRGGWPLYALVDKYATAAQLDEETTCLATAVYFEARGESVEGQLAVARVVINRAASGKYPATWCETVKQPWQFSFVQHGQFPKVNAASAAWARAQAIAELAKANIVPSLTDDVLWYHADYVAPSWGHRLQRVTKVGAHIFYRA
jgi:N-acetylmuramoyl-L-alanine amidase